MPVIEIIKYEPRESSSVDIISYKHEEEDFGCKAQLLVAPSQVALFVNEGEIIPFGPGHYTLSESNNSMFNFINKFKNMFSKGETSFHCSVYFINMVTLMDVRFGTQTPIPMVDPIEGVDIHVRAAGTIGAHIDNDDKDFSKVIKFFNKVIGTRAIFTKDDLSNYLKSKTLEVVTDSLGKAMLENGIGINYVAAKYSFLSNYVKDIITPFFENYGVAIDNFSFATINCPDEDMEIVKKAKLNRRATIIESEGIATKRSLEGYTYQDEKGMEVLKTAAGNQATGAFSNMGMGLGMGAGMGMAFGGAMGNMASQTLGQMGQGMNMQQGGMQMGQPVAQQPAPQAASQPQTAVCPKCGGQVAAGAKFCPNCGNKIGNFCPKCGAEIAPGAKFCPECGNRLTNNCPNCGVEVPPGTKFCPNCGNKME